MNFIGSPFIGPTENTPELFINMHGMFGLTYTFLNFQTGLFVYQSVVYQWKSFNRGYRLDLNYEIVISGNFSGSHHTYGYVSGFSVS